MVNPFSTRLLLLVPLLFATGTFAATAPTPAPEVHQLHVRGSVKYRCYAGYDGKVVTDEMTKERCDNKDYNKVVIDKNITIKIAVEPSPDDSKDLAGSWNEKFEFKGRTFEIGLSLFKAAKPAVKPYRLRIATSDNEPAPRRTAILADLRTPKELNSLTAELSSAGKKEEIEFNVTIEPATKN
jgi:hypothetical protein